MCTVAQRHGTGPIYLTTSQLHREGSMAVRRNHSQSLGQGSCWRNQILGSTAHQAGYRGSWRLRSGWHFVRRAKVLQMAPANIRPRLSGNVSQGLSTRGMCAHMPVLARPSAPQTLSPRPGSSSAQQRAPVSSWFNTGWAAADRQQTDSPRFDYSGRA